uniref:Reverse transcriptase Ty1/copia-type domain-containing protein n=1 Tax=Vitis vinifera TaxID=29760 RepID=A5C7H8_VITVI|nr:hypothetical protein VITISV_026331 [Vitis vinifera]
MVVEESIHVIFYKSNNSLQERKNFDDDLGLETSMGKLQIEDRRQQKEVVDDPKKEESPLALPPPQQAQGESSQYLPKDWKFVINHPQDQIIGNPSSGVRTRSSLRNICNNLAFIFQIEPKNIKDSLVDENWMIAIAFLNGFINEEVYVEQPPDFQSFNFPNHVFRLKKALYGLKQAPRAWYERLNNFLLKKGFKMGNIDTTLFIKTKENDMLLVQIYVDDIVFRATNVSLCEKFSKCMHSEFEMSMMGELNFFLGLQIKQLKEGTFINQAKYIRDLLKRFNMEEAETMKTPMSSSIKLDMDEKGKPVNSTMYRGMIGSLLYLTASRPDIMYSVCLCVRFQFCSKESHLSAIKRILRYLKGTMDIGLWYPKGDNFELIGYSDADFAGCKVERKNTSGTCHFLRHSLISWHSKKQNSVALSTAEAEYIAADLCCAQILWMKQTLSDFNVIFEHVPIKCDNTSAINISKNPVQHSRTKHIEIRHHFLRDHAQKGDITLEFVSTKDQLVDIFTKPLSEEQFVDIRRQLGMAPRRETGTSRAQGKRPVEPSQLEQTEARRKARYDTALFIVKISELIFPTLVRAFYSRATYGLRGLVLSTMRGVEIRLNPKSICRILDIPSIGLRAYEAKAWPTVPGFEPKEAVQRLCSLFLGRMKFEKAPDGSWVRKAERQARGQDQIHPGVEEEAEIKEMEDGLDPQRDFEKRGPELDIPPLPQISSLGTCMEELALVHDSRFYSMKEHLDQYQTGVTSRFDHFQQRFELIEERMD